MTMPHLMNCAHSEDGWCLDCVGALWEESRVWRREVERLVAGRAVPLAVPLPDGAGHADPTAFVAVHRARLERLEQALDHVARWRESLERAEYHWLPVYVANADALLWGVPCGGCGCAETLCCCEQGGGEE